MSASPNTVVIDEALFVDVMRQDDPASTLGSFTRLLRAALRGATVVPMPGLELSQSLEALMKVARHRFESAPALLARCEGTDANDAAAAAMELCEETMALAIWLRNLDPPDWLFDWIDAPTAFRAHAHAAERAGQARQAVHWTVACCLLSATRLGSRASVLVRADVERLVRAETTLGVSAVHDEIQAWHDLFASYRLFR